MRDISSSDGEDHIKLVKMASKRIIDEFDDLSEIFIDYEAKELRFDIRMHDDLRTHSYTTASFHFRPDIIIRSTFERDENCKILKDAKCMHADKPWKHI